MNTLQIAEVCHEVNRAYCLALGDDSQPSWEDAPEWQQISAIRGVRYHIENPGSRPSNSHEEWLRVKRDDGWKIGVVKDPELKEHPCMVPFDKLPVEQQAKDFIFHAIVRQLEKS